VAVVVLMQLAQMEHHLLVMLVMVAMVLQHQFQVLL
jgi:hypothetical protein